MKIVKKNINKLKPSPYNPRESVKNNKKFYDKLKKSIENFGYIEPIIYNKRNKHIVGGHQRFEILKDLNYTVIDAIEIDVDDKKEKALNIALNKISGKWNVDKLEDLLRDLEDSDFSKLTGFDNREIDKILNKKNNNINLNTVFEVVIECNDEFEQKKIYDNMVMEGYNCRLLTL